MTVLVLFGLPGAGKSFIGRFIHKHHGFYQYEADSDLTPAMLKAIEQRDTYTDEMRSEFTNSIMKRIGELQQQHENIVVTQSLAKEKFRKQILTQYPNAQFIYVHANIDVIQQRLSKRKDCVDMNYAKKIQVIYETPLLPHIKLVNNSDLDSIQQQLNSHLFQEALGL